MSDVTVRGIPEGVYERLKREAERNRRSLNQEIVHRLEASVRAPRIRVEEHLTRMRQLRERLSHIPPLDDEFLHRAINEGRR